MGASDDGWEFGQRFILLCKQADLLQDLKNHMHLVAFFVVSSECVCVCARTCVCVCALCVGVRGCVCVRACMHCVCACACVCMHVCTVCALCACVHACMCVRACSHVWACVCAWARVCVHVCACVCACVCVLATQSCPTLRDPMHCSLPGSSIRGIINFKLSSEMYTLSESRLSQWPMPWTESMFLSLLFKIRH